jgi:hypothetical protein
MPVTAPKITTGSSHARRVSASCRPSSQNRQVGFHEPGEIARGLVSEEGGEGTWSAGHGGECGGDFLQAGFDVGGGGWSGGVGVAA